MSQKRKILLITRVDFRYQYGGNQRYLYDIVDSLSEEFEGISIIILQKKFFDGNSLIFKKNIDRPSIQILTSNYIKIWNYYVSKKFIKLFYRKIKNRLFAKPININSKSNTSETKNKFLLGVEILDWESEVVSKFIHDNWDSVIVDYCWLASLFKNLKGQNSKLQKLVICHDVWHQHMLKINSRISELENLTRDKETSWLKLSDVVIAINQRDKEIFKEMIEDPSKKIISAHMSFTEFDRASDCNLPVVAFVGSDYQANIEGVDWFLNEVWPSVYTKVFNNKSPEFHIYGTVCESIKFSDHTNCKKKGIVSDTRLIYNSCQIVVAPLLNGSGLTIKVVEALSYGKPVVTTKIGAMGLEELNGNALLVQDCAVEFAKFINKLLSSETERQKQSDLAYNSAKVLFNRKDAHKELYQVIKND